MLNRETASSLTLTHWTPRSTAHGLLLVTDGYVFLRCNQDKNKTNTRFATHVGNGSATHAQKKINSKVKMNRINTIWD